MTNRQKSIDWLYKYFPKEIHNITRTSKFFQQNEWWFLTFPTTYFEKKDTEFLNIICEHEKLQNEFHFLKVPFKFIKEKRNNFAIRPDGAKFDLHISSKWNSRFIETRSKVDLNQFKQNSL